MEKTALHLPEPTYWQPDAQARGARKDIEALARLFRETDIKPD